MLKANRKLTNNYNMRMTEQEGLEKQKGGRGRKLEPHGPDMLRLYREGKTIRAIVEWLAEPPRSVTVSAPSVHVWIKRRIALLTKRAEEMKAIDRDLMAPAETMAAGDAFAGQAALTSSGSAAVPTVKSPSPATNEVAQPVVERGNRRRLQPPAAPEGFVGPGIVDEPVAPSTSDVLRRIAAEQNEKDRGPED